jgi:hypothetical protein
VVVHCLTLSSRRDCLFHQTPTFKVWPHTSVMAPAAAPEPTYRKDEKAFCFHHELLYEAKVIDVRPSEGDDQKSGFQYKVHYKGWKTTYVLTLSPLPFVPRTTCLATSGGGNHVRPSSTLDPGSTTSASLRVKPPSISQHYFFFHPSPATSFPISSADFLKLGRLGSPRSSSQTHA